MPDFTSFTKHQLDQTLREIEKHIYTVIGQLDIRAWCSREPLSFTNRFDGSERTFKVGDRWGDLFDCAWLNFTSTVPESAAGSRVVLLLDVHGEMCVVNEYGVPVRGLTTVASTYDFSLGWPGKRVYALLDLAHGGEKVDVWADGACNDLFGNLQGNGTIREAAIAVCDDEVRALYYDFEVLLDFVKAVSEDTARCQQILRALNDVVHILGDGSSDQVRRARAILAPLLEKRGGDPSLQISAVGHAHMDLAWLWPIRETIRKGARTFSTVLALMDEYPDYVFGASQPQYFQWMKDRYPLLYAKIKRRVKEGRLEPQGAMWVEADTNISGGEALVRQILYGKHFFREEFGIDVRYLWLPDVFGYNAALPQILKKAGVDYFSTQKLSWSLINKFPHQSFHWQGIDGTAVLTHMLPEETYNSPALPRSVVKLEKNYHDKGVSEHALLVFGIGDGGGGPGEEHVERLIRIKNLAGLAPVTQEPVAQFFSKWARQADRFPTWAGELYLERHQGTLTTNARNKWYNRKMELALRDLEWTSVLTAVLDGVTYPQEFLDKIWRETLLYQFHDILPGSSIKRVYDESVARYQKMLQDVGEKTAQNSVRLANRVDTSKMKQPVVVQNSLSWLRTEWVDAGGTWVRVSVPSMGYKAVDAAISSLGDLTLAATETLLENDVLIVQFDVDGAIHQVYDKRINRKVIVEGEAANRLAVYRDDGDAWDFPMDYAERAPRYMKLVSTRPFIDGPRAVMEQTYRLGHSEVVQKIVLMAGSTRIDFQTRIRWREPRTMLRTCFPVAVHTNEATFDIQFGHIRRPTHRNTTWDMARDEVAAHKWVDLSQRDYGVALLNDSKYGHKVKGHTLDLNLLRSVPYPGPCLVQDEEVKPGGPHHAYTDQCEHQVTYALYPHLGDHIDGHVVRVSYELNVPLRTMAVQGQPGTAPAEASFIQVGAENVIVEAVKQAQDGSEVIVRLYECEHRGARATVRFGFPIELVHEVDLLEENPHLLPLREGALTLSFRPFEIKTLRVVIKR
ncbi:MAG: alpha-mannosidase [Anaerolineae bacterium]|nr:alpha-mannosidase [Anaerolineae bacterium]